MRRSRIRITLLGNNANIPYPIDLHEYNVGPVDHKDVFIESPSVLHKMNEAHHKETKRMLPYLALNEVSVCLKSSFPVSKSILLGLYR